MTIPTVPQYSECTFDVPQVAINANGTGTSTLTLSTNLPVNVGSVRTQSPPFFYAGLFGLGCLGLTFRRRLRYGSIRTLRLLFLLTAAAMGAIGCTNSGYSTPPPSPHVTTPSGMYNVRLYATGAKDGAVKSLPFTVQVTVQ